MRKCGYQGAKAKPVWLGDRECGYMNAENSLELQVTACSRGRPKQELLGEVSFSSSQDRNMEAETEAEAMAECC